MSLPRTAPVVAALGLAQTIAWASSYYLPAVLATPMARDLGVTPVWVFGGFTLAMVISALVGPWGGGMIDRHGGRRVLPLTNLVFAAGLLLLAGAQGPVTLMLAWAVIGLGMGSLACHSQPGETWDFFEIDSEVADLAAYRVDRFVD